ncbi:GPI transamidase component PIG-S [Halyomorpha halys]|uniref:GPI transamidase component PIG-S n=1 Tax=Halyomorpha halys TaxID=286706 RepID=UPI0006D517A0|nr:GPI transamidase component PIG-S [Halyomorpha halys]
MEINDKNENSNNGEKKEYDDEFGIYRMWSAISFSVMLIVIGVPLWWKTTEVYRASLPYDEIHALDPSQTEIKTTIFIYSEYPTHANEIIRGLLISFEKLSIFNVEIKPFKIDIEPISFQAVENSSVIHPSKPGQILLVEVPSLPYNDKVLVSTNRIIYFTYNDDSDLIAQVIMQWFFEEEALINKVTSIISPQKINLDEENSNRLRAALGYDIIFTVINSDPENINFNWDVKTDVKGYMEPLLSQISKVSSHALKSQWLYLMDLGEVPRKDESGWYTYKFSQLPHIITPLEKKLGSGISKNPCVHMILYVAGCSVSPLCFLSSDELRVEGMISPQWGAVQILNPSEDNCANHTEVKFFPRDIMSIFISQFHALLGIREKVRKNGINFMSLRGPLLRSWELDSLYRIRTVEQITSASLTLQSLSKLLGEINNIVINEDVANSIDVAVKNVKKTVNALKRGDLDEAMEASSEAFSAAETAFSDPSLLSLLYFPDDQKYAVYIPLFLPIMIPVIMSLKRTYSWLIQRKLVKHEKTE